MRKDTHTREMSLLAGPLWRPRWFLRNHRVGFRIGRLLLHVVVWLMEETPTFTYDNGARLYYLCLPARKDGATP